MGLSQSNIYGYIYCTCLTSENSPHIHRFIQETGVVKGLQDTWNTVFKTKADMFSMQVLVVTRDHSYQLIIHFKCSQVPYNNCHTVHFHLLDILLSRNSEPDWLETPGWKYVRSFHMVIGPSWLEENSIHLLTIQRKWWLHIKLVFSFLWPVGVLDIYNDTSYWCVLLDSGQPVDKLCSAE